MIVLSCLLLFVCCKGTEIERLKKAHSENQSRSQLGRLADELQGVQKIMIDNIDAALNRGELISGNDIGCSSNISSGSFL